MSVEDLLEAESVSIVSDLHLGSGDSVLDAPDGAEGMRRFAAFLDANVPRSDVFILLGDVFDLALATYAETVPRVQALLDVVRARCNRIVYVPGNHDHHMWLLANEEAEIMRSFPKLQPGFAPRAERSYKDTFLSRLGDDLSVAYPNVYWRPPRAQGGHAYVFHHGHFCEDLYTLVSDLYRDAFDGKVPDLDILEGMNAGWVELVWYHLGQAGRDIGADGFVERFYDKMLRGETDTLQRAIALFYARKIAPLVRGAIREAVHARWYLPDDIAEPIADRIDAIVPNAVFKLIVQYAASKPDDGKLRASSARGAELDAALAARCRRYVETYVVPARGDAIGTAPRFVFGHTHVFGVYPQTNPTYFNTGGWITSPEGDWPDAFVFHVDAAGTLTARKFGKHGELETQSCYPCAT